MSESLFTPSNGLDINFLDEAYGDDAETAALMFQQYLDELPGNMALLNTSIENNDVESFRHLIHKQKPVYSYVGLTDVTGMLQDLQVKCHSSADMNSHRPLINSVMERIQASASDIRQMLVHLQSK